MILCPAQRRTALPLVIAISIFMSSLVNAQISNREQIVETVTHEGDVCVELVIPAENGQIVWKDVATALAKSLTLDAATVESVLPSGSLNVRSEFVALAVLGINIASDDKLSIDVVRDEQNNRALRLRCHRSLFARPDGIEAKPASIELDKDWAIRSVDRPLVICVHGLRSGPQAFESLRDYLRQAGYATAAAGYDDEQSIARSAQQLSEIGRELLGSQHSRSPSIALVGHSMGGLVAREWTENDQLQGEQISTLITIASPHGGSNWATMPPLLDLVWKGDYDHSDVVDVMLHQPSSAGLRDLAPGSPQLCRMNERPRRGDVHYTTIVGTGSPVSEIQVAKIASLLGSLDNKSKVFRLIRPRFHPLLDGIDELVRGKGDGAVAVQHATIEGVDDVVTFDQSHGELIRPRRGGGTQQVWDTVLDRLERGRRLQSESLR